MKRVRWQTYLNSLYEEMLEMYKPKEIECIKKCESLEDLLEELARLGWEEDIILYTLLSQTVELPPP